MVKTFILVLLLMVPSVGLGQERFNLLRNEPVKNRPPVIETHITNNGAKTRIAEPKAEVVAAPQTRKANDGGPDWQWDENRRVWWRTVPVTYSPQPQYRPVSQPVFRNFRSYSVRSGSC